VALIRGLQANASYGQPYPLVGATAKHFFGYNLESNFAKSKLFPNGGADGQYRLKADVNISATDMTQTYLPAFAAAVTKGEARSVMCSYVLSSC
jgi:beta-glucosidase-like glycosyl hydrolase